MRNAIVFPMLMSVLILSMMAACEKVSETGDDSDENEDPADYTWDTSTVVMVKLNESSITCDPEVASIKGSTITITSAGTYNISGSLTDGQVIIDSEEDGNVRLILNEVNIKCSFSAPINIKDASKAILILEENTNNYLTDGTTYVTSDGEPNAALFSNSYLAIYGNGSLTIKANYNDGISTDDGLLIKSGNITINAADDGIRGKDYVKIADGNISVNSKGDGIKSDNEEDTSKGYIYIEKGTINITSAGDAFNAVSSLEINDGTFNLISGGGSSSTSTGTGGGFPGGSGGGTSGGYTGTVSAKGLKCGTELTIKTGTFVINSADDAVHSNSSIVIEGGNFEISTNDDAFHAENSILFNDGDINITRSFEAVESASVTVNKGNIILSATNDGFNATKGTGGESNDGSILNLNGGYIVANVSNGDGLDSNGNIVMTGGTVIVHGPSSSPEVAFDFNGSFNISGGILVAGGPNSGNMIEVPGSSSSQYCIKATSSSGVSASTLFHIEDSEGNSLLTFKPVRSTYYFVFSSSALKNSSSYSIYTGGSSSGSVSDGYYSGGTYTGGTLKKTFTISSKITSVTF